MYSFILVIGIPRMSNKPDKHFWDETRKPWMDLEGERKPIRPQKSGKASNRSNETTGMFE